MPDEKQYRLGYARVSTDDQNLDLQIEALTARGVPRDMIYTDRASTRSAKREGLTLLKKALRKGDKLVIWKMDRLGRDISELIQTADFLRARGVELEVITESFDTTTAHGRLFFHMIAAFAQYERDLIRERTVAGLRAAAAKGRKGGRQVKFTLELQERARQMLREGKSRREVATALDFHPSLISKYWPALFPVSQETKESENGE